MSSSPLRAYRPEEHVIRILSSPFSEQQSELQAPKKQERARDSSRAVRRLEATQQLRCARLQKCAGAPSTERKPLQLTGVSAGRCAGLASCSASQTDVSMESDRVNVQAGCLFAQVQSASDVVFAVCETPSRADARTAAADRLAGCVQGKTVEHEQVAQELPEVQVPPKNSVTQVGLDDKGVSTKSPDCVARLSAGRAVKPTALPLSPALPGKPNTVMRPRQIW